MYSTRRMPPRYEPSPLEIREMCLLIQDEWSNRERRAREAGNMIDGELLEQWSVHEVRVASWE